MIHRSNEARDARKDDYVGERPIYRRRSLEKKARETLPVLYGLGWSGREDEQLILFMGIR